MLVQRRIIFFTIIILFTVFTALTGVIIYASDFDHDVIEESEEEAVLYEDEIPEEEQGPDLTDERFSFEDDDLLPEDEELLLDDEEESIPVNRGVLVFVIDDAGNSLWELEQFLNFPGSLTIAVLPGLPNSIESARLVREAGMELILHQPMESLGGTNPGPGAILNGMEREEIREIVNRNLDELWPVAGMNNHEGSRITMNEEIMEIILEICREREIYFLDSRTTADSVVSAVAGRMEIPFAERHVFIDNFQSAESMETYINAGLLRAEQRGYSVMIGHAWSIALAPLLKDLYPELIENGFIFSTVSELLMERDQ